MKKTPTLFERVYENHKVVGITNKVTPGMEWVLTGEGDATVKYDGSCCAIVDGEFYKRYDAKKGRKIPDGAIKCQDEPDPITGHIPCWVKCDRDNPADKWFWAAYDGFVNIHGYKPDNGTFEATGVHFQSNPYKMKNDQLLPHGNLIISNIERTYEGIRKYLSEHYIEGIVFWKDGEPRCKIKRSDFGYEWGKKK